MNAPAPSSEPAPRPNLIAHIRQQIEAGTYVTAGKVREAERRMLEAARKQIEEEAQRDASD